GLSGRDRRRLWRAARLARGGAVRSARRVCILATGRHACHAVRGRRARRGQARPSRRAARGPAGHFGGAARAVRGTGGGRAGGPGRRSRRGRRHSCRARGVASRRRGRGHLRGARRLGRRGELRAGVPQGEGGLRISGWSYGAPCPAEVELAELVRQRMPAVEMVRFVNSGTEATMAAVRLARAATQRDVILKFEGCYHGHADSFLVKAGSGVATLGLPDSPGVPAPLAELTLTVPFNDLSAVEALF